MQFVRCVLLMGLFFALGFSQTEAAEAQEGFKTIGVEEFDKLRSDKASVVLDVRTPREFSSGHIAGAINIDWNGTDFLKKVEALDKTKVYLVHCSVGGRSARAARKMSESGFSKIYNLQGGFAAWQRAGKATEP